MPFAVRVTPIGGRQIVGLRGLRRKAYEEFEKLLSQHGCVALDYRLTGGEPLSSLCVKHLRGADWAVVAFAGDEAWVLLVGPHAAGDSASDVYTALYDMAGVARSTQPRTKPLCCDEMSKPPALGEAIIDDFVSRARRQRR